MSHQKALLVSSFSVTAANSFINKNFPFPKFSDRKDVMEEFYKKRGILLTGATGFVGKVVLEKILRCLLEVHTVYVLIRPKCKENVDARLQKLFNSQLFTRLKAENPTALQKVVPIEGDIALVNLGISSEDKLLLQKNVSVVIHSAATINFDENLKTALNVNVIGTQHVVDLSKDLPYFRSLVYVSTAYSNCDKKDGSIQERVYPVSPGRMEMLQWIEAMSDEDAETNAKLLIGDKPNSYTFTKSTAEWVFEQETREAGLAACIVRPSMVTPSLLEPIPGWVDSLSGPVGLIFAAANGLKPFFFADPSVVLDFVPVDMVANMILVAAWATSLNRPFQVYNCCSGPKNPVPLGYLATRFQHNIRKVFPLSRAIWYPRVTLTINRTWYLAACIFYHYIPCYMIDIFMCICALPSMLSRRYLSIPIRAQTNNSFTKQKTGKSTTQLILMSKKIAKVARVMEYFSTREWEFESENVDKLQLLQENFQATQQANWSFKFADIDWELYLQHWVHGARKYLANDPDETLGFAKRRMLLLCLMDHIYGIFAGVAMFCLRVIILLGVWSGALSVLIMRFLTSLL